MYWLTVVGVWLLWAIAAVALVTVLSIGGGFAFLIGVVAGFAGFSSGMSLADYLEGAR